jgi:putative oxidoreductase
MTHRLIEFLRPVAYTRHVDAALLLLRTAVSAMMLTHGWPKLAGFAERSDRFYDFMGLGSELSLALAVFAEFFCSIALFFGLGARLVLVPLIITTVVIVFVVHAGDPYEDKEHGLLFLVPYLTLMLTNSGRYAIDHLIFRRRSNG